MRIIMIALGVLTSADVVSGFSRTSCSCRRDASVHPVEREPDEIVDLLARMVEV